MSWSDSVVIPPGTKKEDVACYMEQLKPGIGLPLEHGDQLLTAKSAAVFMINSGAVGDGEKRGFRVSVSGHTSPEHRDGGDCVNVCVSSFLPPVVETPVKPFVEPFVETPVEPTTGENDGGPSNDAPLDTSNAGTLPVGVPIPVEAGT